MDFFDICTKEPRKAGGPVEVYPDFKVSRVKDLMVQGKSFYAIWDEEQRLWSRDEYLVQILVDREIRAKVEELEASGIPCTAKYLQSFGTKSWTQFITFVKNLSDNSHPLDTKVTFANTVTKKSDYVSRRLPYNLEQGSIAAYEELVSKLYSPEERAKFEWAIGAIISGDAKKIEKFLVFYGAKGTGKSTVMNIAIKLFGGTIDEGGYVRTFDAAALTGNNNNFATEAFKDNPLLAIQQDGNLAKIEDNSKLNSIVSHDVMQINQKFKAIYDARVNALLMMGTNSPVRITDAKSGLIRRLIDVNPTGDLHDVDRYDQLVAQVDFELGAIAYHCLETYKRMGKNYYSSYRPLTMMLKTDVFFNFVEAHFDIFEEQDGTTLKQAWSLYKEWCNEALIDFKLTLPKFREELKNYFKEYHDRGDYKGVLTRSYFIGFTAKPYKTLSPQSPTKFSLVLNETTSLFDKVCANLPAQYAREDGIPRSKWDGLTQTLEHVDTSKLHYVKLPLNHIVIDFDLKDENGLKSLEKNLEAASEWPATYAELSKSGDGVHLHYLYTGGDPGELANVYSEGIEIKVFTGNSSLRRRLSKCNNVPVATLTSGLPFKEKKSVNEAHTLQSERGLRTLILRNLKKEIHPGTKSSVDFIYKILEDAYKSGMPYDVSDMYGDIISFAGSSTNQADVALDLVLKMKFKSEVPLEEVPKEEKNSEVPIVFWDCEVYKNLFVLCWKYRGSDTVVRMINPTSAEVEPLLKLKLIGFYNRDYDNHILWARLLGYNNEQLYALSKKLTSGDHSAKFGEAYSASYCDIYDFSSTKQGLKMWMVDLGIHKMEMDIPWDEPVPDNRILDVVEYCVNDVLGTEATFEFLEADFTARLILAELSGVSVNETTKKHISKIVFGNLRDSKPELVYTDLREEFPGYEFDPYAAKDKKSTYRDEFVGEGGYVYAEPGMYENVAVLDIESMHPTTIVNLNLFGKYTERYRELLEARLSIKHGDFEAARTMFGGKLAPYLTDKSSAEKLGYALKIALNIVYGLTMAKYDNMFKDPRNVDNIVAKRGALFMVDLKNAVQARGFQVIHIKTDSIKIPNASPEIIEFVQEFGRTYGYEFQHEATYDKMCLVNNAVYIAKVGWNAKNKDPYWYPVGAEFQHPVVFKALFSDEPITFDDLCEVKQVSIGSAIYIDFDAVQQPMFKYGGRHFIGRIGRFLPVTQSAGGGLLLRVKDGKDYAVSDTKGYLWVEADMFKALNLSIQDQMFGDLTQPINDDESITEILDMRYYENMVNDAIASIEKYGDFNAFVK